MKIVRTEAEGYQNSSLKQKVSTVLHDMDTSWIRRFDRSEALLINRILDYIFAGIRSISEIENPEERRETLINMLNLLSSNMRDFIFEVGIKSGRVKFNWDPEKE